MFLVCVGFLCGVILMLVIYGSYQLALIWDKKALDYNDVGCKFIFAFFWCIMLFSVVFLVLGSIISLYAISGQFKYGY